MKIITKQWKNDQELFQIIRKNLYTAVIGDIMDKLGFLNQFLPPEIRPLDTKMFIVGRAMTVLEEDIFEECSLENKNPAPEKPFGLMLEALDNLMQDEVYICSGSSSKYALVGEIMMTRAHILKAAGAVVNGYSRDTRGILKLGLPVFSYGPYSQDQAPRGKVKAYRVPIKIGSVIVNPGDIIVGDIDGVCIVPREIEMEVITMAWDKASGENRVLAEIQNGMSANEAWNKFGIM
jgi:regulator of RNase E activity RraA